jgi:hypothetical protein
MAMWMRVEGIDASSRNRGWFEVRSLSWPHGYRDGRGQFDAIVPDNVYSRELMALVVRGACGPSEAGTRRRSGRCTG